MGAYNDLPREACRFYREASTQPESLPAAEFPSIETLLDDTTRSDSSKKVGTLLQTENPVKKLLEILASELKTAQNTERRNAIFETLVELGNEDPLLLSKFEPALIDSLNGSDPERRRKAAWAVGCLAKESPTHLTDAVGCLEPRLADSDWKVRAYATGAVGRAGTAAPDLVSDLVPTIRQNADDEYVKVRRNAVWSIGLIGRESPTIVSGTVPTVLKALDDVPDVSQNAAWTLGLIGEQNPSHVSDAVEPLVNRRYDEPQPVRRNVLGALGRIGREDPGLVESVREPLQEIVSDSDEPLVLRALAGVSYAAIASDVSDQNEVQIQKLARSQLNQEYCPSTFLELLATQCVETPSFGKTLVKGLRAHCNHGEDHARSAIRTALSEFDVP